MRKLNLLVTAMSAALLVLAFQNCGSKMNFSSNIDEVMNKDTGDGGALVLIEDEPQVPASNEEGQKNENGNEEIVEEAIEIEEEVVVIEEEVKVENNEEEVRDEVQEEILVEINVEEEIVADYSNDSGNYICILEGPGKSVRLGFDSEQLVAVGQTPQVVCSTKRACEDLVSQAFEVKAVAKRGFCGKNPHTHSLTEAEIATLLGL